MSGTKKGERGRKKFHAQSFANIDQIEVDIFAHSLFSVQAKTSDGEASKPSNEMFDGRKNRAEDRRVENLCHLCQYL